MIDPMPHCLCSVQDLEDENPDAANAVERGVLEREGVIQQKLQAAKSSLERALIAHWQSLKSLHTQQVRIRLNFQLSFPTAVLHVVMCLDHKRLSGVSYGHHCYVR